MTCKRVNVMSRDVMPSNNQWTELIRSLSVNGKVYDEATSARTSP